MYVDITKPPLLPLNGLSRKQPWMVLCVLWMLWVPLLAWADHPGQAQLVQEVAKDTGKSPATLNALLNGAKRQQSILDAMGRPAEAKPWSEYREIFLTPERIDKGINFYREHRALLEKIGAQYGVAPEYIVAILGVETLYGRNTGRYKVLDALVTLGLYYPPRATFFRGELKTLLELPDNNLAGPVDTLTGSYAGAQGWGQFMPSSIRDFAVDEDGDGRITRCRISSPVSPTISPSTAGSAAAWWRRAHNRTAPPNRSPSKTPRRNGPSSSSKPGVTHHCSISIRVR
jgi:hypothetical protein